MSKNYVVEALLNTFKFEKELFAECNMMVAGGVFTSLFTKQEVNDVDCYFRSKDDLVRFLTYINEYGSKRYCISVTDKSVTLIGGDQVPIQLIYFKYFKDLKDVFNTFDFTVSMCGYDFKTKELEHHEDFFSDLSQRRLKFNNLTAYPLVSALRVNKFKDRGYEISRSEMIKILLTVAQLDIKTPKDFVNHVGGFYGNSALALLTDMDETDFTIEKGLEVLAKNSEGNKPEINKVSKKVTEASIGVHSLARLLNSDNPLEGKWYRKDNYACYLTDCNYSRKHSLPLDIALLFAPHNEAKQVKKDYADSGMFYKWVNKTDDAGVFESIHRSSFKYKLGEVAQDTSSGLFFTTDKDIEGHYFSRQSSKGVILMCHAELKDLVKNASDLRFSKVTPLAVVDKPLVKSPEVPDTDNMFDIKPSVNHCRDEELALPDVEDLMKEEPLQTVIQTSNLIGVSF